MGIPLETVAGANAGRSRDHNRRMVLGHIRAAGHMGRAEIARTSGLSTQAVSNIIADLHGDGLLVEQGRISAGRGLPALQYALNPAGGYALGVEIRPDALFVAILDLSGETVLSSRIDLPDNSPDPVTQAITTAIAQALKETRISPASLMGAGIVMPGPFGTTGSSDGKSELPAWRDVDARAWFEDALNLPVIVENDANAAAMSEHISGVAKGLRTYAYLYFGAGLGLGLVMNGRLYRGAFGNAGEIGHVAFSDKAGTSLIEARVSRVSVQNHLDKAGVSVRSGEELTALYDRAHPMLMAWLDQAHAPLSYAISLIENFFDPETIILGGALPDPLIDHLIDHVALSANSVSDRTGRQTPRLLRGASGRLSATLGGAGLVLNRAFTPQITA